MSGFEQGLQRCQGMPRASLFVEYPSPGGRKVMKGGPLKRGFLNCGVILEKKTVPCTKLDWVHRPPTHPHTHRPHLGMSVCVSTIVTVSNLEMHRGHIEEGNRNVPFNQMFQS